MIEQEEIKKLIKRGFNKELISFELDIPIELVKKCEKELNDEYINRMRIKNREDNFLQMQQMKQRYKTLFYRSNKLEVKSPKKIDETRIELINSTINTIKEIIDGMKEASREERRKKAKTILLEIKKIESYPLTIKQAEELTKLKIDRIDNIDCHIKEQRESIIRKLVEAINISQYETVELEELDLLARKITPEVEQKSPMFASAVRSRIRTKILNIKQKEAVDRIRNNISPNIELIIRDLANGTIDIKKANTIIDEEAKKIVESKPQNKFSLTQEQERNQILIQIKRAIAEKADRYQIENPIGMVIRLNELCRGDIDESVGIVVENLINRKDFNTAKSVCSQYSIKNEDGQIEKYMRSLKNRIRNAEISDLVLKCLNMNGTEDEQLEYFALIKKRLRNGKCKIKCNIFMEKPRWIKKYNIS